MKQVINANEYKFKIKVMPHGKAHGLYLIRENYPEHLLAQSWTIQECKDWIFNHFIGEKGTKFNIEIEEGFVAKDENSFLYLQKRVNEHE